MDIVRSNQLGNHRAKVMLPRNDAVFDSPPLVALSVSTRKLSLRRLTWPKIFDRPMPNVSMRMPPPATDTSPKGFGRVHVPSMDTLPDILPTTLLMSGTHAWMSVKSALSATALA